MYVSYLLSLYIAYQLIADLVIYTRKKQLFNKIDNVYLFHRFKELTF